MGKKRAGNKTANYMISSNTDHPKPEGPDYIGKLRDFDGKRKSYSIYDHGKDPKKMKYNDAPRRDYGTVEVGTTNMKGLGKVKEVRFIFSSTSKALISKKPVWSESKNGYVLNFNGRASESSVKNCQLISEDSLINSDSSEDIIFQFGKYKENIYNLDVKHPLSIFQAFNICLTIFDSS